MASAESILISFHRHCVLLSRRLISFILNELAVLRCSDENKELPSWVRECADIRAASAGGSVPLLPAGPGGAGAATRLHWRPLLRSRGLPAGRARRQIGRVGRQARRPRPGGAQLKPARSVYSARNGARRPAFEPHTSVYWSWHDPSIACIGCHRGAECTLDCTSETPGCRAGA